MLAPACAQRSASAAISCGAIGTHAFSSRVVASLSPTSITTGFGRLPMPPPSRIFASYTEIELSDFDPTRCLQLDSNPFEDELTPTGDRLRSSQTRDLR